MIKIIQILSLSFLVMMGCTVENNKTFAQKDEPLFVNLNSKDAEYQLTVKKAQSQLSSFGEKLKGMPRTSYANIKTYIPDSNGGGAFIWLSNPVFQGDTCVAVVFEIPSEFANLKMGDRWKFHKKDIQDWYILDKEGRMEGGFSLRYHRSKLSGEKQKEFDEYVGVKEYL